MSKKAQNQTIFTAKHFKVNSIEQYMRQEERKKQQSDFSSVHQSSQTDEHIISANNLLVPLNSLPNVCISTSEVNEDDYEQRSVIQELNCQHQLMNQLRMSGATKTFDALGIRRSHSYEKDKFQLSISSDCVDCEHEREAMRRKIDKLTNDIEQIAELQIATKSELLIYKKRNQRSEQNNKKLQKEINRLRTDLNQCTLILRQKEQRIAELESVSQRTTDGRKQCERYENLMKLMSNDFQNRLRDMNQNHQRQIQGVKTEFQNARGIGQSQIDQLTKQLQQKDQELIEMQKRLKQVEVDRKSTIVSESLSVSKVVCRKGLQDQQKRMNYLERFYHFSESIDRKICNSSEKRRVLFEGMQTQSIVSGKQPSRQSGFMKVKPVPLEMKKMLSSFQPKYFAAK